MPDRDLIVIQSVAYDRALGWIKLDETTLCPDGDYVWTRYNGDLDAPARKVSRGILPSCILEPLISASSSFSLRDGARVFVDRFAGYIDYGEHYRPRAVSLMHDYLKAMHRSDWGPRYGREVVASVLSGNRSLHALCEPLGAILNLLCQLHGTVQGEGGLTVDEAKEIQALLMEELPAKREAFVAQMDTLVAALERGETRVTPDAEVFRCLLLKMASRGIPVGLLGSGLLNDTASLVPYYFELPERA